MIFGEIAVIEVIHTLFMKFIRLIKFINSWLSILSTVINLNKLKFQCKEFDLFLKKHDPFKRQYQQSCPAPQRARR